MNTKFIKFFIAAVLFSSFNLTVVATTHTVTNGNDAGTGSLRQIVADANSGDTIIFAPNVPDVYLTDSDIYIDKDLTIIGATGDDKVTINAGSRRIFSIDKFNNLAISNLILTGANHNNDGGAVRTAEYSTFTATNCIFSNNAADYGGAVYAKYGDFTAINCIFSNNYSSSAIAGVGSVVYANWMVFTAINCIFSDNSSCVITAWHSAVLVAINCTFTNNISNGYAAGVLTGDVNMYLYHCTIVGNKAENRGGVVSTIWKDNYRLYTYNCIITENTVADTLNHFNGLTVSGGHSLIEGENGVTHELVFGNNVFTNGYIMPLEYAKSASRLTANDIETPSHPRLHSQKISADSIIFWLYRDQAGNVRPETGFVTFGAVEYDGVGIKEDGCFDILVLPNITDRDFTIIFDNPETQTVSIELIDLEGKTIFSIYEGTVNSGIQVYRVNENLANGIYFVKFVFKNKVMIRKVIVRK